MLEIQAKYAISPCFFRKFTFSHNTCYSLLGTLVHMCYMCVFFLYIVCSIGGCQTVLPHWNWWMSVLVKSFLPFWYHFLFPYPVMLLLPMAVPAAQSWPVRGKDARPSSATIASKYGIQIRHAIWRVSKGRRLCEYGPSTLRVSVMGKNLDQV